MTDKDNGGPAFPNEVWASVPGYPGLEVTSNGRVRTSIDRRRRGKTLDTPKELKTGFIKGYRSICIRRDGGRKTTLRICRAILLAFVGEATKDHQACHGNGIKDDDRLENLRWGTVSENTLDQVKHGVHRGLASKGDAHPLAKFSSAEVIEIKGLIAEGMTSTNIAKRFGVPRTTINSIKIGKSWSHIKLADAMLEAREKQ